MLGIEILKRLGGGGGTVNIQDDAVHGTTYAQWTIGFDGWTYERHNSGAASKSLSWINPQSGMDKYEVRVTVTTGDTPDGAPGAINVWQPLSTSYTYGWANQLTEKSCTLLVEIRTAVGHTTVDSASITIFVAGIA